MVCHFLLQGVFLTQDPTQVSCMTGGFFTIEPPGKPHLHLDKFMNIPVDKIHYQPETAPRYGRCFADHTRNYVLVRTLLVMYNRIWTQSKEDFLTHITELVLRIERSAAKIRVIATWTRSLTRPRFLPHPSDPCSLCRRAGDLASDSHGSQTPAKRSYFPLKIHIRGTPIWFCLQYVISLLEE